MYQGEGAGGCCTGEPVCVRIGSEMCTRVHKIMHISHTHSKVCEYTYIHICAYMYSCIYMYDVNV